MRWLVLAALFLQTDELERHRNLGKAYYEQGEYALAVEQLSAVLESSDAGARDYFNAAMAFLQNAEQDRALATFKTAQQMDPELIEVDFGLGVLYKRQLRYPLARDAFMKVVERDPDDPSTWFNMGAVEYSMNLTEEAEEAFERVRAMGHARAQNFYVSALFRLANIRTRRGEQADASELFEEFQALRDETPNVSLTPTALENGRYGRLEIPVATEATVDDSFDGLELKKIAELRFADSACEESPSLALGDFDDDGDADLVVASPCGGGIFRNDGHGPLALVAPVRPSSGASFVDFDNSGSPELYAWSDTGSRRYQNRNGRFEEATPEPSATSALFLDADNDGRVDLFVSEPGTGLVLYRNLGEGRFAPVWRDDTLRARGAAAADFDANGFVDIVVATDSDNDVLLSNEGLLLEPASVSLGLTGTSHASLYVVDFDHDGRLDLVARDEKGTRALVYRKGRFELLPSLQGWATLVPVELDGDGYTSFLGTNAGDRRALVSYRGGERFETRSIALGEDFFQAVSIADGLVFTADREGVLRIYERTKPASPGWVRIALRGTKTNRQALGALVEVKAGRFYQKHLYPGYPSTIFVGRRERLDVVRITWANGVIQNEVDVPTGQVLEIEEAEQMTSSCPFIYVWNGTNFRFLTDVVGRAPLGEILPDGSVVVPNPEDYVRIPADAMVERDGRFVFRLTEELRELAVIDAVELLAIDHPAHIEVYTNERFSAPPFEPFLLYPVEEMWRPAAATNERGEDVLPQLLQADGQYVSSFSRHRISGFAEEHAIVLQVPEIARAVPLRLFLNGWVYWPSSSSMKALASHDSMAARPPALQIRDETGSWVTAIEDLGLPSGIGRTFTVELPDRFLTAHGEIRIVSNFAVYWDHAFFGRLDFQARTRTHVLEPRAADLHYRGFSRVVLEARERPERYDYTELQSEPPWNAVLGRYTRYGDVISLLDEADGETLVMAPGDETSLSFDARILPTLPDEWKRTFFLHVTGWAKDQDPNTISSRSVAPLPARESSSRSREVPALVTPLAPPKTQQR